MLEVNADWFKIEQLQVHDQAVLLVGDLILPAVVVATDSTMLHVKVGDKILEIPRCNTCQLSGLPAWLLKMAYPNSIVERSAIGKELAIKLRNNSVFIEPAQSLNQVAVV